ncbi:metallophosphoesterase [Sphingomonas sp. NSE70-1]|uniref:Metallophosphoesterase n=1 Tax=Sphingomonas caseinilyticus TaxID=2908205 RepID=A0ABT0RRA6_9SPHN|nr:metallophosphoesterase [Sphingomonas caseinilyticus]MCL6697358.1 metallophosphoesterase [Sphingomonas caseinilyticus]
MLGWRSKEGGRARTPRGRRAYAIGDVHGRLDLLDQLLLQIEQDIDRRPTRKAALIFLGDLIDRGADSRGVIERLRNYRHSTLKPYFLAGNHEEVLLRLLQGERGILTSWLKYGGAQCLASYGLDVGQLDIRNEHATLSAIRGIIPNSHVEFISGFGDTLRFGDYLFVHAGIRPGIDLELQSQSDLRWIRSPFLEDKSDHGMIVVHGHTISNDVEVEHNRIGIDTGAYRTGRLSALAVEGEDRWFLDTAAAADQG